MNKRVIMGFILCFLIGLGLVIQSRITDGQMLYVSAKTITDYQTVIDSEKVSVAEIEKLIAQANETLELYESTADRSNTEASVEDMTSKMEKELMQLGMFVGFETVKGAGVIVTIDDGTRELLYGEDINNVLVHDLDILTIVNEMRRCGAEAISVNGQRIVNRTSISCSGYTVRINGTVYARPFVIRAIGDGKRMSSALLGPQGYGTSLKGWGVQFKVEMEEELIIDGYTGGLRTYKYMSRVKGDESN